MPVDLIATDITEVEARILTSARVLLEKNGLRRTRIDEIASRAGVSRQTVYKYYDNKQDILDRVNYFEMLKIGNEIRLRTKNIPSFPGKLVEAITASVQLSLNNSYVCHVVDTPDLMPHYPDSTSPLFQWQVAQWEHFLRLAFERGKLASDLDINQVVRWIILAQVMLVLACRRNLIEAQELSTIVSRFVTSPLLQKRAVSSGDQDSSDLEAVRTEAQMLRELVSQQALDLFTLNRELERLKTAR